MLLFGLGFGSKPGGVGHLVVRRRHPAARGPWLGVGGVQLVDFFQRQPLGFVDKEVDKEERKDQTPGKHKPVVEVDVTGDEGREERDEEPPEPVTGRGNTHGLTSDPERIDFRDDRVDTTGPRRGKEEDEQTGDEDQGVTGRLVRWTVVTVDVQVDRTQHRVDDETHRHTGRTRQQTVSSSETLNGPDTDKGRGKVDNTQNDRCLERVLQPNGLENRSSVVEKVVVTGQLLQTLQHQTDKHSVEHLGLTGDQLRPRGRTSQLFTVNTGLDQLDLGVDSRVFGRKLVGSTDGLLGLVDLVLFNQVTGRFRHHDHTTDHQKGPGETQSQGDSPLSRVVVGLGTVGGTVTQKDPQGDVQLETTNQRTSNLLRRRFSDKQWRQHRETPNGQPRNGTANDNLVPLGRRRDLDDYTNHIDGHGHHNPNTTPVGVSNLGQKDTPDGTPDVEDTDNDTGSDVGQIVAGAVGVKLAESFLKVGHVDESGNGTGIKPEHEPPECNQQAKGGDSHVFLERLFRDGGHVVDDFSGGRDTAVRCRNIAFDVILFKERSVGSMTTRQ